MRKKTNKFEFFRARLAACYHQTLGDGSFLFDPLRRQRKPSNKKEPSPCYILEKVGMCTGPPDLRGYLLVVAEADVVSGLGEGVPGDVKPGGTGEELVSKGVGFEEVDEALELSRIFRADVGGLADEVLGIGDTANQTINPTVAEA